MTYIQAHRKNSDKGPIIGVLVIVIVLGLIQVAFPHFFSAFFTSIARPFWRTQLAAEMGSLQSRERLLQENADLKRKLMEAEVDLQSFSLLENENTELKSMMGRASSTSLVLSAVLKRPPQSDYDELIIDAGEDLGFKTGDFVHAPGNVLIGRLSQIMEHSSKVILFSSPGQKNEIMIGPGHVSAVSTGRGGGQYQAQLPRDIQISEGDHVTVPSLDSELVGIVSSVVSDPTQPFETVMFAPPVNLYQLKWVLVDKKSKI